MTAVCYRRNFPLLSFLCSSEWYVHMLHSFSSRLLYVSCRNKLDGILCDLAVGSQYSGWSWLRPGLRFEPTIIIR